MRPTRIIVVLSAPELCRRFQRSFSRRKNFNPDQVSVTAHTFTSTKPTAKPISRTIFSSRSVTTPELFLGQLTHSIPAGPSCLLRRLNSLVSSASDFVNSITKSSEVLPSRTVLQLARADFNSTNTPDG